MNSRAEGIHEDLEWNVQDDHLFTKRYYDHVDIHCRDYRRDPNCEWCQPPKRSIIREQAGSEK